MNAEQRIKLQIGELIVQLAVASADNEAKAIRIAELEAKLAEQKSVDAAV